MKILIIGAGAIGIWVASQIRKHDPTTQHAITLLGRPRFVAAANEASIQVSLLQDDAQSLQGVRAISSLEALPNADAFDVIIVCTKAYSVPSVIADLQASPQSFGAGTRFVCFQNGVGSEEIFAQAFGAAQVVAATTTVPVSVLGPAAIRIERLKGGAGLASMAGAMVDDLAQLLGAVTYADWRAMKWSKLLLNIVGNASSAIVGLPVGQIYAQPAGFALEVGMLRECLAVMQQLGLAVVDLPGSRARQLAFVLNTLPNWLLKPILTKQAAKGRGDKMPSFYYEVANHSRQCEVGYLNGAIAAHGQNVGVATPINVCLNDTLSQIIAGAVAAADWQGKIDKLWGVAVR